MNISDFIHKEVAQTAVLYPNRIAVVLGKDRLSYAELEKKATQYAQSICAHAPSDEIIGISTRKTIETIPQLLGILKSGRAYMPLDPDYPIERLQYMVGISGLKQICDDGLHASQWVKLGLAIVPNRIVDLNADTDQVSGNPNAALLFTSGSTGKPKGVLLTHAGLYNNLRFQTSYPWHGPGVKTLQYAHLAFDGAILEIFSALWTGGELHLMEDIQRLDNYQLLTYLSENKINRVFLPNVTLNTLIEEALHKDWDLDALLEVTTAGELLKTNPILKQFFSSHPNAHLKNAYGPTETSVCVTEYVLSKSTDDWPEIPPIGLPLPGCQLFVLDGDMATVKNGEIGELYISGVCVATGYINRADLTEEKFVFWMNDEGEIIRLYKTGDLVLRDAAGQFHFKGRQDDQIKIRGNRVELGEVEYTLSNQKGVQQAVVKLDTDDFGQRFLCAYVKSSGFLDIPNLKKNLKRSLPEYMVPEIIVAVDDFKKTSSGKIDRNALPIARQTRPDWSPPIQHPANALERNLLTVFKGILMVNELSTADNFFEFGGNSIKAQQTISQLRRIFGYNVPIAKLYQHPTVKSLGLLLAKAEKSLKCANSQEDKKLAGNTTLLSEARLFLQNAGS